MELNELLQVARLAGSGVDSSEVRCRMFAVSLVGWIAVDDVAIARDLARLLGMPNLVGEDEARAAARCKALISAVDAMPARVVLGGA